MATKTFLDKTGLQTVIDWIKAGFIQKDGEKTLSTNDFSNTYKEAIDNLPTGYVGVSDFQRDMAGKVDKADGKGLSTNDFTTIEKQKLQGVASGAQVNVIETIKRNGTTVQASGKSVDIKVPTKVSELTNDAQYATVTELTDAINKAGKMTKEMAESIPEPGTAKDNVIYLVPNSKGAEGDSYSEYLLISGKMEKIGTTATEVDLTGYLTTDDVVGVTTSEIWQMINE